MMKRLLEIYDEGSDKLSESLSVVWSLVIREDTMHVPKKDCDWHDELLNHFQ